MKTRTEEVDRATMTLVAASVMVGVACDFYALAAGITVDEARRNVLEEALERIKLEVKRS